VQADASAYAGQPNSHASASANAQNPNGEAITTAVAPGGSGSSFFLGANSPSALSAAAVGSGGATLAATFTPGQSVSNAILALSGSNIGVGGMSAAYGGLPQSVDYSATAVFDFIAPNTGEALDLKLTSDESAASPAGIGFDKLNLQVVNATTGTSLASLSFTSSSAAKTFFNGGQVSLGVGIGNQSIEIEYSLNYNSGTSAGLGDGFGFTYALVDPPLSATIPEPSTWTMMFIGFAGLAFAGYRARARAGSLKYVT
jgi:hypothetical protein